MAQAQDDEAPPARVPIAADDLGGTGRWLLEPSRIGPPAIRGAGIDLVLARALAVARLALLDGAVMPPGVVLAEIGWIRDGPTPEGPFEALGRLVSVTRGERRSRVECESAVRGLGRPARFCTVHFGFVWPAT